MTDRTPMSRSYRIDSHRNRAQTAMAKADRADASGDAARAQDLRRRAAELIRQGAIEIENEYRRLRDLDHDLTEITAAAADHPVDPFHGKMTRAAA